MNLYSLGGQVLVWTNKLNAGLCKNTKMCFECLYVTLLCMKHVTYLPSVNLDNNSVLNSPATND